MYEENIYLILDWGKIVLMYKNSYNIKNYHMEED
jgi:hypothetical protein